MDFLDPRKRRAYHIRLFIGYILMAIAIGLGVVILVYGASGYGVTKNGEIVQNGLLFVDSKPGAARIYLNGQDKQTTTSARLILPAGNYTLTLKKDGYRDWSRSFVLDEHSVARYVYPFLFPVKPVVSTLKTYGARPPLFTESPDQHWLLVQLPADGSGLVNFDEYDTTSLTTPPVQIRLPQNLLTSPTQSGSSLSLVEWSTDNNHLLLRHDWSAGSEFIIVDRNKPETSVNLNRLFNTSFDQVALYNKKIDQVYLFDSSKGTLSLGDTATGVVDPPLLSQVLAFKPYGTDLITYVTDTKSPAGQVSARIWDNGQTYQLYSFQSGSKYLIDAAQYQGHWYYVAGSNADPRINIYKDPLNDIRDPNIGKATPLLSLNELGATKLSFSDNARFIAAEDGGSFSVYDMETQTSYAYDLPVAIDGPLVWMDGHRLIGSTTGFVFVTDYDGTNEQGLVPTIDSEGGLFSGDYNHMFTLQQTDGGVALTNVDMRAGSDLPKNPSQQ